VDVSRPNLKLGASVLWLNTRLSVEKSQPNFKFKLSVGGF